MASSAAPKKDEKAPAADAKNEQTAAEQKPTAALEEDDEFEDFPVDDWAAEDTEAAAGESTEHLWEESWDDDDTSDDFSNQLREELKKVEANKKR
ncbi:hypothetical protein OQA88_11016 [Cercophora sp. LCS_1]